MKNLFIPLLFGLFLSFSASSQVEFVSHCDSISTVHELSTLSGLSLTLEAPTGELFNYDLCGNGDIDNPHWLAFTLDPLFEYSFEIIFSNCGSPLTPQAGGQLGIFTSCNSQENPVYCYSAAANGSINLSDNTAFEDDEIYYLILDGYAGSVCDVEFKIEKYLPLSSITDWYNSAGSFGGSSQYWYSDIGDTIINGLEYRVIENYPLSDFPFSRFIREDNDRKVYEYNVFSMQDQLLYDFNATLGDQLELLAGTFTVVEIDEVESEIGLLKRWKLDGPGPPIYVTEGIGSEDLFLANTASDPVFTLLCAYNQENKIYGNEDCAPPPRWVINETFIDTTICAGSFYQFSSFTLSESGIYVDTLIAANGLDSIIILELTVSPPVQIVNSAVLCPSECYYVESAATILCTPGIFNWEYYDDNFCLIQEMLTLTEALSYETDLNYTLCPEEIIIINGTTYDINNPTGSEFFYSTEGCDSTVNIQLNFEESIVTEINQSLCQGQSFEINGIIFDETSPSGNIVFQNEASNGCDSIVSVELNYVDGTFTEIDVEACEGEEISFDDVVITSSGMYSNTFLSSSGCDSTVTLSANFLPSIFVNQTYLICPGDTLVFSSPDDPNIIVFGEITFEINNTAVNGCDSVSIIEVFVLDSSDPECLTNTYEPYHYQYSYLQSAVRT